MKLPLTVERVHGQYWPVITDADGKELNQEVELDENEVRELVAYANAYHKVKEAVKAYLESEEDERQDFFVTTVLDHVDLTEPK
jgi:hypothetical protein